MRQFLTNNEAAFRELEQRAEHACVRFRNQELPPGCEPPAADVGFEIDTGPGTARLLVSRGIRYTGDCAAIYDWLGEGVKEFASFAGLRAWIQGPLAQAFNARRISAGNAPANNPVPDTAGQLTDLAAVHQGIREINRCMYLDEENLFERLRRRVLGQDDALKTLAGVVVRHCARRQPTRPAVVFAVGPSGVGKTRTAEMASEVLRELDDQDCGYQFLRLDMTEYQEPHRVSQLIGAPQGYIGHGEGSQLLDVLRANPNTIVLFDEIEKAHPAILRVLMNAMDAGRLSTASRSQGGHEIDCRRAIFIFTTNVDAKEILDELETRSGFGNRTVEDEVCRRRLHASGIAPEIVGRIGRFLVYRPLSPETRAEIVALAVAEVGREYGINVAYVEPGVIVDLMQKVRSESFGVRPERFLIDDALGSAFAKAAQEGVSDTVKVTGPPYECKPHVEPEGSVTDDKNGVRTSEPSRAGTRTERR